MILLKIEKILKSKLTIKAADVDSNIKSRRSIGSGRFSILSVLEKNYENSSKNVVTVTNAQSNNDLKHETSTFAHSSRAIDSQ